MDEAPYGSGEYNRELFETLMAIFQSLNNC
jgi:hypothetical protein